MNWKWTWLDGTVQSTTGNEWAPGEPTNPSDRDRSCVRIREGLLRDISCSTTYTHFLCQSCKFKGYITYHEDIAKYQTKIEKKCNFIHLLIIDLTIVFYYYIYYYNNLHTILLAGRICRTTNAAVTSPTLIETETFAPANTETPDPMPNTVASSFVQVTSETASPSSTSESQEIAAKSMAWETTHETEVFTSLNEEKVVLTKTTSAIEGNSLSKTTTVEAAVATSKGEETALLTTATTEAAVLTSAAEDSAVMTSVTEQLTVSTLAEDEVQATLFPLTNGDADVPTSAKDERDSMGTSSREEKATLMSTLLHENSPTSSSTPRIYLKSSSVTVPDKAPTTDQNCECPTIVKCSSGKTLKKIPDLRMSYDNKFKVTYTDTDMTSSDFRLSAITIGVVEIALVVFFLALFIMTDLHTLRRNIVEIHC